MSIQHGASAALYSSGIACRLYAPKLALKVSILKLASLKYTLIGELTTAGRICTGCSEKNRRFVKLMHLESNVFQIFIYFGCASNNKKMKIYLIFLDDVITNTVDSNVKTERSYKIISKISVF